MTLSGDGNDDDLRDGCTLHEIAHCGRFEHYNIYAGEDELEHGYESTKANDRSSPSVLTDASRGDYDTN